MSDNISTENLEQALKQARKEGVTATKRGRAKMSDEEKARLESQKAEAKAERERLRAERRAQREQKRPHMAKVARAASKLPKLDTRAEEILNNVFDGLDASAISAFIVNVQHRLRAQATESAVNVKLEVGQLVTIKSGDARYIGQQAEVVEVRRIRCHVQPIGTTKRVYLLNSDVEVVDVQASGSQDNVFDIKQAI